MTRYLSSHFTEHEACYSETAERLGIDNTIPNKIWPVVQNTAQHMEVIRNFVNNLPIHITSWYRGPELQKLPQFINPHSQHPKGEAVDFKCPEFGTPADIVKRLAKYPAIILFDQLILEHSWVHISFCSDPTIKPRCQVLSLLENKSYALGITDKKGNPL